MARVPKVPFRETHERHRRETIDVVKPEARFRRPHRISIQTDRSPQSVTRINPDDMRPILPEMIYIPPA
jgi:hypothetical protein